MPRAGWCSTLMCGYLGTEEEPRLWERGGAGEFPVVQGSHSALISHTLLFGYFLRGLNESHRLQEGTPGKKKKNNRSSKQTYHASGVVSRKQALQAEL